MMNAAKKMIDIMSTAGLVPLFSHDDPTMAQQIVEEAYAGGARIIEFTNRKPNALTVFTHLVKNRNKYPEMMLGIGTILDGNTTTKFIDAGADFIVSPILNTEMAEVCQKKNKPWIPGCATPTEIMSGRTLGAEVIKIFPGATLGPGFVSSILSVAPDLNLMVTGGVEPNAENLKKWFDAGTLCVGLGSHLIAADKLNAETVKDLSVKIEDALSLIQSLKKPR
jgi:2-dehydro-3-deoxyphosphogluconate aldolase / (4S)-4-hydroxy-2-oxoglutarate aldolase